MKLTEIYSRLSEHMIQGMMIHEQLANYYDFLGLRGYKECHEYHFLHETMNYRCLCKYFINHHNMLIPSVRVDDPNVIPESWYSHNRQDVDSNTRKNAIKTGLSKWVEWERDTKKLYEDMYSELMEIDEVASACKIKCFIEDVDHELKKAELYQIDKEAINYDMTVIMGEQLPKKKYYKEKWAKEFAEY